MKDFERITLGGADIKDVRQGSVRVWPDKPPFSPLDLDPLVWWAFDGDLTDTVSALNLTNSLTAAYENDGINGRAVRYGTLNNSNGNLLAADVTRETSVCWWSRQRVATASLPSGSEFVIIWGNTTGANAGTVLRLIRNQNNANSINNGIAAWVVTTLSVGQVSFDAFPIGMNVWRHYSVVVGENVGGSHYLRFYVDGVLWGSGALSASFLTASPQTNMSIRNYGCDWCDMMIFKKALTAAEVGQVYGWRK
jgi:hypothetical protein